MNRAAVATTELLKAVRFIAGIKRNRRKARKNPRTRQGFELIWLFWNASSSSVVYEGEHPHRGAWSLESLPISRCTGMIMVVYEFWWKMRERSRVIFICFAKFSLYRETFTLSIALWGNNFFIYSDEKINRETWRCLYENKKQIFYIDEPGIVIPAIYFMDGSNLLPDEKLESLNNNLTWEI